MEEEEGKGLGDYLDIIRRRKYWVIFPALILMALSVGLAYWLPATYKSEGLILIESQEIPNDLIKSTVTSYADQRIAVIKQRLMTTPNIIELIKKHNLYAEQREKNPPISALVDRFRGNVAVDMVQATVTDRNGWSKKASIAFRVSFLNRSPQTAQKVTNDLVTSFLNENVRIRTERASQTKKFLESEGDKFQVKLQQIEKAIGEFKDQYSESLPELLQYNLSAVERLQEELLTNQNSILLLKDQITTMSLQLSTIPAYLDRSSLTGNSVPSISSAEERLIELKNQYNALVGKYSASHPDVISLKRQLKFLEEETGISSSTKGSQLEKEKEIVNAKAQLTILLQRYSVGHPDIKALKNKIANLETELKTIIAATPASSRLSTAATNNTTRDLNPIYVQIKGRMDSAEREIVRIRGRQGDVKVKLADYENRVFKTHQVKREYDDLTRDHDNTKAKYTDLRAKQLEAELAENLESEKKGESFTLIEPPLAPTKAEKPNRQKVMIMGFMVSIAVGLGLALLVEIIFGGVRGYNEITRVTRRTPLVVIPIILTAFDIKKQKIVRNRWLMLVFILFLAAIAGFHFYVMDLEVLWFKIMRKVSQV
ncbi:MAG: sugar transporter [Methylophaga sp.]|nr:MAG: sugar transporter [Methylophaga sp.]